MVLDFVQAVCLVGNDDDWDDRRKAIESTAEKLRSGDDEVVGWPRLAETIGDQYVKKLREWLQIPKRVAAEGVLTDTGNADRFITRHGKDVRCCDARGGYYVWDGTRWTKDDHGAVMELAKETARSIFEEAKAEKDHTKAQALAKWAATSLNYARLSAMVNTAKTDPSIVVTSDAFDRDPWAFNVMNGTIDLMTGGLRAHDRSDLLTKRSPIVYDPDATAPGWTAFLLKSTGGDQATVGYLQRLIGYMLTGRTTEQILAILYGDGQNGKSVFVKKLEEIFGDYSLKIPTGVLMHNGGSREPRRTLLSFPAHGSSLRTRPHKADGSMKPWSRI